MNIDQTLGFFWGERGTMADRPKKVILDVDTGLDDAVGIVLASLATNLDILGFTTVCGNCFVEICTENTLRVLDSLGLNLPVYEGMGKPLARPYFRQEPSPTHGSLLNLPPAKSEKKQEHGVDWLIKTLLGSSEMITLIALGPLTNLAVAFRKEPAIIQKIDELVIMGGGECITIASPAAEFNFWVDPEAAKLVLEEKVQIRLLTLDATHQMRITREHIEKIKRFENIPADLVSALLERYIEGYDSYQDAQYKGSAPLHDPVAVSAVIDPDIILTEEIPVTVETRGEFTEGCSVFDNRKYTGLEPTSGGSRVQVARAVDTAKFLDLLYSLLSTPI